MKKCDKITRTERIEPMDNARNTSIKHWGQFNSMIKNNVSARGIKEIIIIVGSREDKLNKK